jgi:hypothetical protein
MFAPRSTERARSGHDALVSGGPVSHESRSDETRAPDGTGSFLSRLGQAFFAIGRTLKRPGALLALAVVWAAMLFMSSHVEDNTGLLVAGMLVSVEIVHTTERRRIRRQARARDVPRATLGS